MTDGGKDGGEALRDTRNRSLEREQERLTDPDHLTPEEEGANPDPAEQREAGRKDKASPDQLTNPPQVKGPREKSNDMT